MNTGSAQDRTGCRTFRASALKQAILYVLCLPVVIGCASTANLGTYEDSLNGDYVPIKEETWAVQQADKFHAEISDKGLLYRDQTAQAYVSAVESAILAQNPQLDLGIEVYLLRSPVPNASALPNGVIYIHTGLFTVLESEDQLAAIIAHEIAHVTERHSIKAVVSRKNTLITAHIADLATGGLGLAYFPAGASIMSYSRLQESEADQKGIEWLHAAGYEPRGMVKVFEAFQKLPETKHVENSIYSSHPSQTQRIADLSTYIASIESARGEPRPIAGSTGFTEVKATLMESNVRMRLRYRQFHLAQSILQGASDYYGDGSKIAFFTGEVYRGFYFHPTEAAEEKLWIETGKTRSSNKYVEMFEGAREQNLAQAEAAYLTALQAPFPYTEAYKRMGELKMETGDPVSAREFFVQYLAVAPTTTDRRYVERMIDRLNDEIE